MNFAVLGAEWVTLGTVQQEHWAWRGAIKFSVGKKKVTQILRLHISAHSKETIGMS